MIEVFESYLNLLFQQVVTLFRFSTQILPNCVYSGFHDKINFQSLEVCFWFAWFILCNWSSTCLCMCCLMGQKELLQSRPPGTSGGGRAAQVHEKYNPSQAVHVLWWEPPSQCHPASWYLSVGDWALWPDREGENIPQSLIVCGFSDLSHLLMLLGSPGIFGESPSLPSVARFLVGKYQAWVMIFCWLGGYKMPQNYIVPPVLESSTSPPSFHLSEPSFGISYVISRVQSCTQEGKTHREMSLHHLIQTVSLISFQCF